MPNSTIRFYNGITYEELSKDPDWVKFVAPLNKTPNWNGMVFENCKLFRMFIYDFKTCGWKYLFLSSVYLKNVRKKYSSPIIDYLVNQIDTELRIRYERKEIVETQKRNPKYIEWYLKKVKRMRSLRTLGSSLSKFKKYKKRIKHLRMKKRR